MNPRGLNLISTLYPALIEKYKFAIYPSLKEFLSTDKERPSEFAGGQFTNSKGDVVNIKIVDYEQAIVVDTASSTRDSEAFLRELLEWMTGYGLVFRQDMVRSKGYLSELTVRCELGATGAIRPELRVLAKKLSSLVSVDDRPISYGPSGISIAPDTTESNKPAAFIFERSADALFKENR